MNNHTRTNSEHLDQMTEAAHALVRATGDVAGDGVQEARDRLSAALAQGKGTLSFLRDQAVAGTQVADTILRENSYQAIAVGVGVGILAGYLITRRGRCRKDVAT